MTDDPAEDEIGEPGVDVTDLLVATYRRGQRDAFAEAAELTEIAGGMFSGRTGLDQVDEGVAVHRAFWTLIAMFKRRADPDAKPPEVVGDE